MDYENELKRLVGIAPALHYFKCDKGESIIGCPVKDCNDCVDKQDLKEITVLPYTIDANKRDQLFQLILQETPSIIRFNYIDGQYWYELDHKQWYLSCTNNTYAQAVAHLACFLVEHELLDKEEVRKIIEG